MKTTYRASKFKSELKAAAGNAAVMRSDRRRDLAGPGKTFCGMLYYDVAGNIDLDQIGNTLVEVCSDRDGKNKVDFIAFGNDFFLRHFVRMEPTTFVYRHFWRAYKIPGLALGYFVMNAVECISPFTTAPYSKWWWPEDGKEPGFQMEFEASFTGQFL